MAEQSPGREETADLIRQRTLADAIVDKLTTAILYGRIRPGESLTEEDLARRFGVSRGPVREALRQLQEEGVVQKNSHSSASVRKWSIEQLRDLVAYRALIESFGAGIAAERRTGEDLVRLHACVEAVEQTWKRQDLHALVLTDVAFHLAVSDASHHAYAMGALRRIERQIQMFMITEKIAYGPAPLDVSIPMHRQIVHHIEERESSRATGVMERHILQVMDALAERADPG